MTSIRDAYLIAAQSAVDLINEDAVASAWAQASALEGFTIGGLASHLAGQIFSVRFALTSPQPDTEPVPMTGHYERASWVGAGLDAAVNVRIRASGETRATAGASALREEVRCTPTTWPTACGCRHRTFRPMSLIRCCRC